MSYTILCLGLAIICAVAIIKHYGSKRKAKRVKLLHMPKFNRYA